MRDTLRPKDIIQHRFKSRMGLCLLLILVIGMSRVADSATLDTRYPGLSSGLLQSAELAPLDGDILLVADGVTIKRSQLLEGIKDQDPKLRAQLEKNLFFVLEQKAIRRILLNEAQKAGITSSGVDDNQAIQALFEHRTKELSVSEAEARVFYQSNKEMVGGASFEQVVDGLRQYLLQDKRQRAVADYINQLGASVKLRINANWVEVQNLVAMDNPVDKARRSGKPTMVEFGATGCVPCDMMQPILDNLRKSYPDKLNVVFVHVREEQVLAARYDIRSIPVQAFFDATGKEVFRHVGFFAEADVKKQLAHIGVEK